MNVIIGPVWRSAAFWTMLIANAAQIAVGIGYGKEATMMATVAATVITYLVARGVIVNAAIKAAYVAEDKESVPVTMKVKF